MPLHSDFLTVPLAHRGLHDLARGRPENSVAAFRAALDAGYGIELDVQVSRDGEAMVFHDEELERLTAETGPVNLRSAAQLSAIPLRGATEGIPTLMEVLDLVDGRCPVLIEIKDQSGDLGTSEGALERAVLSALSTYEGPAAVMSFNPHPIAAIRDAAPEIAAGLVTDDFNDPAWGFVPAARRAALQDLKDTEALGLEFISHNRSDLDNPAVARLKKHGLAILCWTIRSETEEAEARRIVDNITFEGYAAKLPDRRDGGA